MQHARRPATLLLAILLLLAAACRASQSSGATVIPRFAGRADSSESRWIAGLKYDPRDVAVAWPSADTLIIAHVELYSEADVGGSTCGGSGLYAVPLAPGGHPRAIGVGEPACRAVGYGDGSAFDTATNAVLASVRAPENRSALVRIALPGAVVDTLQTGCKVYAEQPDLSADGRAIAFRGLCAGRDEAHWGLYIVGADGAGLRQLPVAAGYDAGHPRWSPDGRRIAYVRSRHEDGRQDEEVVVVDADSAPQSDGRVLARGAGPAWSPDGRWVAYLHEADGRRALGSIRVVRADGSGDRELFRNRERSTFSRGWGPYPEGVPGGRLVWSPDGRWVAFTRGYDPGSSVWRVDVQTGEVRPVTRPDH